MEMSTVHCTNEPETEGAILEQTLCLLGAGPSGRYHWSVGGDLIQVPSRSCGFHWASTGWGSAGRRPRQGILPKFMLQ